MLEREIKCHVPSESRQPLDRALKRAGATPLTLHACYFDTPDRALARARVALRLRLEQGAWMQTLKAPGPDALTRLELNHPRPGPTLDLEVYRDTPIAGVLQEVQGRLGLRYETLVERQALALPWGASQIELAWDVGTIRAGSLELPLHELEFELLSGRGDDLFALAADYLARYRLVLDLRSKSERGDLLARAAAQDHTSPAAAEQALRQALTPARRARPVQLAAGLSFREAARQGTDSCLDQIIRNATLLAGAERLPLLNAERVDYIHQMRVGMRRLRSLWKFFAAGPPQGKNSPPGGQQAAGAAWGPCFAVGKGGYMVPDATQAAVRALFQQLGDARDGDVVRQEVLPRLQKAGMPALALPTVLDGDEQAIPRLVAAPACQGLLLQLLRDQTREADAEGGEAGHDETGPETAEGTDGEGRGAADAGARSERPTPSLDVLLARRLNRWLRAIERQGQDFENLPIEARHDLRKRVKRLRYAMDASASRLQPERLARIQSALAAAQATLGELNDLYVAEDYFRPLLPEQPQAWFALGWLRAAQAQKSQEAARRFGKLAKAGRYKPA